MSPRMKVIITAAVMLMALTVIVFFAYLPLLDQIEQSSAGFTEAKQRLAKAESAIEDLARLEHELEPYPSLRQNLEAVLIDKEKIVSFLTLLERLSKDLQLRYDIQLLTNTDKNKMGFQVTLVGDFINVARFIRGLENLPFLTEVQRWQILRVNPIDRPSQGYASSTNVTAGLTVSVFTKE